MGHGIGGVLGEVVEAREARMGAVAEAGVGLAAAGGGLVEHRSVELRGDDVVVAPPRGDGAQGKGLQFRLRDQAGVDASQVFRPDPMGGRRIDGADARHLHAACTQWR